MMIYLKDCRNYLKKADAVALLEPPVQDAAGSEAANDAKDDVQADSDLDDNNEQDEDMSDVVDE
jgi:hypothetical protein